MAVIREYDRHDAERQDRSASDRQRHRDKVKKALRKNIGHVIAEESIIGQSGDKKIKVPIKGIKEYRFVYGDNNKDVMEGKGGEGLGDVVGRRRGKKGNGQGNQGGEGEGEDIYETEITLDELIDIMLEDLGLPELERKALKQIETDESRRRKGYRRAGIRARLDKFKTAKERIKRMKASQRNVALEPEVPTTEEDERFPFRKEDLRYKHMDIKTREESNAVVICIMDTSGSMYEAKKYMARSLFYLLYQFVKRQYTNAEIVFISHAWSASEVTEDEFFHKGESGGTMISSGLKKALEIIEDRYDPSLWNVYTVFCSDGENFDSDNKEAVEAGMKLMDICNLFGYVEITENEQQSALLQAMYRAYGIVYNSDAYATFGKLIGKAAQAAGVKNFVSAKVANKDHIWPVLREILSKDRANA